MALDDILASSWHTAGAPEVIHILGAAESNG